MLFLITNEGVQVLNSERKQWMLVQNVSWACLLSSFVTV